MKQPELEPSPLTDILRGRFAGPGPAGTPTRVALELEGDAALAEKRYADALVLYKAARAASWRVKSKMGWCCWYLGQWAAGARYLEDAPRRGEAVPLVTLIQCVAAMNGRTGEKDQELDSLVRALLALPEPDPYFYELADTHLIDKATRLEHLRTGHERFPTDPSVRRRYTRAAWAAGAKEDVLFQLVHAAAGTADAAPADLWQGFEIATDFQRHDEALGYIERLRAESGAHDEALLTLVLADVHTQAGDLAKAAEILATLFRYAESMEERGLGLHAAKASLHVAVLQGDQRAVEVAAKSLATVFCKHGIMAVVDQSSPLDPALLQIAVGDVSVGYLPLADIRLEREQILAAITDSDLRALFKVLYASQDGPYATLTTEECAELTLSAGEESTTPYIQRQVAWARMEAGQFEGAGQAFALFDLARAIEAGATWSAYDGESIFEDEPYNDEAVVDHFAEGMIHALVETARGQADMVCDYLHEIVATYLRAPLLHYKLYTRFHATMACIVDVYRSAGAEPTSTVWFDLGLACHYIGRKDEALSAYAACLVQHPNHAAALANQLALAPPAARADIIIGQAIDAFAEAVPPATVSEMSLREAVYLLTLYRACGGAEQNLVLLPFGASEQPFAPTPELLQPLFALLRAGIVKISRETPAKAFTIEQAPARVTAYVLPELHWELPAATMGLIREIEKACLSGDWPADWREQAPALAQELATHECLTYLRFCAEDRGLPMPSGEKTMLMIENALTTYSVGQAYAFCWQGAAAAADYRQRKGVSALHAGNTIVGNCQRRIDQARVKKWEVSNYTRPREVRRTHLSYTLFDAFLGFGDHAFTVPLAQLFEETYGTQQRRAAG